MTRVATLLFFSGLSALIYQTVWMREFRLIFGASTSATAAVLAIFMAGLGLGSALLGKRADRHEQPLGWYARLELYIAGAAALSPALLWVAAKIYFASGGSPELGIGVATLLRLALAALVLAPATLLMGGTLPAAARAVENDEDNGRRSVAVLYGVNTLGAVAGALLSTFVLLEALGNRTTLFVAVVINVIVAFAARAMSANRTVELDREQKVEEEETTAVAPSLVYTAAAIAGFSFLLMELVWYRMLSPILGGTAYMFGLVLAVALFGIGLGGAAYAFRGNRRATAGAFALTCSFEALAVALPFAIGDRLAVFTASLHSLGTSYGFPGFVFSWVLVTSIVVLPAAFIAGVQFPLLISLLGRGRENVGRQVGAAYAWNTLGAIAGSLAGGFGLLPLLSAPTTWRVVAVLLAALALVAAQMAMRDRDVRRAGITFFTTAAALAAIAATGPTAAWRHVGIGTGRLPLMTNPNELDASLISARRMPVWQRDGRESSVALTAGHDYAFIVNGKSDGAARGDAHTQVMLGLIGSMLHPNPKTSLVVGLGTGSTAGWLGIVPSMERVDVVELEPLVLDVARACEPVNAGVLRNPKVKTTIGDAREVLLTTRRKYDVIASEPSNPYRAGIASLLTREFYEAAADRMTSDGILAQWVQAYAIDAATMRTIYATMHSVFPHVQTWATGGADLVFVASRKPIVIDAERMRARMRSEPYASAAYNLWGVDTAEGFATRMIANEDFSTGAAAGASDLNTDDRTVIEFGFARSVSAAELHHQILAQSTTSNMNRPKYVRGSFNWDAPEVRNPLRAGLPEGMTVGQLEAAAPGDLRIEQYAERIASRRPIDALAVMAIMRAKQGRSDEATELLRRAFIAARTNPWLDPNLFGAAIDLAMQQARIGPKQARIVFDALSQPFSVRLQETRRQFARIVAAPLFGLCGGETIAALQEVEPHPFWTGEMLTIRARCYAMTNHRLTDTALRDLALYRSRESQPLVMPQSPQAPRGSS